jgi:hypothetical protein
VRLLGLGWFCAELGGCSLLVLWEVLRGEGGVVMVTVMVALVKGMER